MATKKRYIIQPRKKEYELGYGSVVVDLYPDSFRLVLARYGYEGGEADVLLTHYQVSKLRKLIDKHIPIATSEG